MRWRSFLFAPAIAYQALVIAAGVRYLSSRFRSKGPRTPSYQPAVSILKPVKGLDPEMYDAFVSQARQNYPTFEILFGVRDPNDPAVPQIRRLQHEFPDLAIQLVVSHQEAANGKVGTLIELARRARYPVWVVNDSDIRVTPEYLASIVAPLSDSAVGVVTCPYRVNAQTLPARWEALGIAVDFMPSTLVAPLFGVREFGFGSTLAFRAEDLTKAGGFEALANYLADDYQLARRITSLGKRALLSTYIVETGLNDASWRGIWQHQLRWARTIRLSKGAGYAGLPFAQAGVWALLALCGGLRIPFALLFGVRMLSGLVTGGIALQNPLAKRFFWLSPIWDLYAFAVWATSYRSKRVVWRNRMLTVDSEGRIQPEAPGYDGAC